MVILSSFRRGVYAVVATIWITVTKILFSKWILSSNFTVPPPFRPRYHSDLLRKAMIVLESISPTIRLPKHTLEFIILSKDPIYVFRNPLTPSFFPSLVPSPAVLWRYWNPKTEKTMSGFLYRAYNKCDFWNDRKASIQHVRWMRLERSVFHADSSSTLSQNDIVSMPNTPMDEKILSFLKDTPTWPMLVKKSGFVLLENSEHVALDCGGLSYWLKKKGNTDSVSIGDDGQLNINSAVFNNVRDSCYISSDDMNGAIVNVGDVILLHRVYRSWWDPFGFFASKWTHHTDVTTFHYAVKLFDYGDLYISKCGPHGGVYVANLKQTMAFYSMDHAVLHIFGETSLIPSK